MPCRAETLARRVAFEFIIRLEARKRAGRGSVGAPDALVAALHAGTIAAAGLDVFEGEPTAPQNLLEAPNVTITPHIAGRSPEARQTMIELFQRNLKNFFSGQPLVTPIPEMVDT